MPLNTSTTYTHANTNNYKWKASFSQPNPVSGQSAITHNHGESIQWQGETLQKNDVITAAAAGTAAKGTEVLDHLVAIQSPIIEIHVV